MDSEYLGFLPADLQPSLRLPTVTNPNDNAGTNLEYHIPRGVMLDGLRASIIGAYVDLHRHEQADLLGDAGPGDIHANFRPAPSVAGVATVASLEPGIAGLILNFDGTTLMGVGYDMQLPYSRDAFAEHTTFSAQERWEGQTTRYPVPGLPIVRNTRTTTESGDEMRVLVARM